MAEPDKRPVTMQELLVSSLAQPTQLAKLMIEKRLITREEFIQKISEERATYQKPSESHTAMNIADISFGSNQRPLADSRRDRTGDASRWYSLRVQ